MSGKTVELLAPAGNLEGFYGALNAGCDAVYLGGPAFGARAYAENFTEEELQEVIRIAHLHNVRIYMTVNILVREREFEDCIAMVRRMYAQGLDGVIVQDLGVLSALHRTCPGLLLHVSTQTSSTLPESARFYQRLGASRLVPARELSLPEIRAIHETGIEVEAFIHGAMCYCYSGRCLMSSFLGGRSGNRGRCAGTCRLPYTILDEEGKPVLISPQNSRIRKTSVTPQTAQARSVRSGHRGKQTATSVQGQDMAETYPLSMRDMCTISILPELIDAGIDSFKIEGRMKKPEYAAGVTAIYRKYLDRFYAWDADGRSEPWKVSDRDLSDLLSLYIRSERSEGYYHERNGRDMITLDQPGYAGTDERVQDRIRKEYLSRKPQIPVRGRVTILCGKPAEISFVPERIAVSRPGRSGDRMSFRNDTEACRSRKDHSGNCSDKNEPRRTVPIGSRTIPGGPVVLEAKSRPLSEEEIRRHVMKAGDSPFVVKDLEVVTDGKSFLPVSALNALRRDGLARLEAAMLADYGSHEKDSCEGRKPLRPGWIRPEDCHDRMLVLVTCREQLEAAMECGVSSLILDGPLADVVAGGDAGAPGRLQEWQEGLRDCKCVLAALPYIFRESDRGWMERMVRCGKEQRGIRVDGFLVRTVEEMEFLAETGYDGIILADSSIYRWNREADRIAARGCSAQVLPLELSGKELQETFGDSMNRQVLPIYGYLPMMVTANCVRKTSGDCRHREEGFWYLQDRRDAKFPVRTACSHCHNIVYNSVPLSLHHLGEDRLVQKAGMVLLSFTKEDGPRTRDIIEFYRCLFRKGSGQDGVRSMSQHLFPESSYTTGHYRKGAL